LEASGSIVAGPVIMNYGEVGRPSQLIASVRWTSSGEHGTALPGTPTTEDLPPPSEGVPWLHMPTSRGAACARKRQFIGKNRQLMSFSGNSATKGIPSRA
jgi:hypothetical protein